MPTAFPLDRSRRRRRTRVLVALLAFLVLALGAVAPVAAAEPADGTTWTAASPEVFGIGDSLVMQCGETLGLGARSSGIVGWPSATSDDLRARLSTASGNWPFMTEPSHADELAGFRDAGTWVVGLGTNDVRKLSAARFAANVAWFLEQAGGRPVLWFTIHHPSYPAQVAVFNDVLVAAAEGSPNLRLLDWHGHVAAHPEVLAPDGFHLGSYAACRQGRFALIQAAVPPVQGQEQDPAWTDPEPAPLPSPDPVAAEHDRTGGAAGPLGAPVGEMSCGRRGGGCAQFYEGGAVAWSPATGAHAMSAPVTAAWRTYGETGGTGYPVGDAVCGLVGGGCRQQFQAGWLYWSATTAPFQVTAPVLAAWAAQGAEAGSLGYPVTGLACGLVRTGCVQHFTWGSVYWSASTGARAVTGPVSARHRMSGAENGRLGYPLIDTACVPGGCGQHFTGGSVYWSPRTGAKLVTGAVRSRWLATGAARGPLGYPTIDTACVADGCGQHFTGGSVYVSATGRGGVVTGAVRTRYLAAGAARGPLGYPTIDTACVASGCGQHFAGGSIYWSSATGSRVVAGKIRARWLTLGGAQGRLGYPATEQQAISGGITQRFQHGTLTWRGGRWV